MSFMSVACFALMPWTQLLGSIVEIVLNQEACLARSLIRPSQALLAPLQVVVILGET